MDKVQERLITRETLIGDIVNNFPEAVEPLMDTGVHCIGCHISPFENLEQGLRGHGMNDEQIEETLNKLNSAIKKKEVVSEDGINITDKAAKKINELANAKNKEEYGLRIQVVSGGCSGHQYLFNFDKKPNENDEVFERKGAKLFIDSKSLGKLKGITLDYLDSLQGTGFRISNPKAVGTWGSSFR